MKIAIPDKVSRTAAKIFSDNNLVVEQNPGIEVDKIPKDADAIVVRSYELHNLKINKSLKAIGRAGAKNAGIFAVEILATADASLRDALKRQRKEMARQIEEKAKKLKA